MSTTPKTKCEFARHLDALPFPANPPPSLLPPPISTAKPRAPKFYGAWLYRHNNPEFQRQFAKWKP